MNKSFAFLFAVIVGLATSSSVVGSVTIQIQNADAAGVGFNDPTPVAPVGGNNGTTLGQQRLNAFQFAADIWGATLTSSVPITIRARWVAQPCTADSGTLGSTGSLDMQSDFPNAPFPGTWYSTALANKLAGSDRNGSTAEIDARFNVNVGTPGCLEASPWYLGLDTNHGNGIDLVTVLLHEFAHGLGFQTFTDEQTGAFRLGMPTIYDKFLFDNSTGKTWEHMTNAERALSAINTGHLTWNGPQVVSDVPHVLIGTPRLRVNSPPPIAGNYQIGTADFGPPVSSLGITGNVVRSTPLNGCTPIDGSVAGGIAFIDRGSCNFTVKVANAQAAGAIGVIIGNVASSPFPNIPPGMTGVDPTINITSVSLSFGDAESIRAQLGGPVNASIFLDATVLAGADSANRALMFAPNPVDPGSSISHFDTSALPDQLMEPNNSSDLTHSVTPPRDLTFSLLRDLGWTGGAAPSPSIQLAASTFSGSEGDTTFRITVTRTGNTSATSSVNYATSDTAGSSSCNNPTSIAASSRCDYLPTSGTLQFAAGETMKPISIPIVDDAYHEQAESFTLTLSNPVDATLGSPATETLTINDNDNVNGPNPIDTPSFFVRQHYVDFLNREPDAAGLNFWTNEITSCGTDTNCLAVKRVNVSAAFFLSIEFQETGYLVYRIYKSAFGNLAGAPVPVRFTDFLQDTQRIGQGVQVGIGNWQAQLEANKQAFALAFVQRQDFLAVFPNSLAAADFVDRLNAHAGGVLTPTEQADLLRTFTNPTDITQRANVLRLVAEDSDLRSAEFNRAFVLMQYFGYLRRNPNDAPDTDFGGYNFWLNKLDQFGGNFENAEMVKAFILSGEFRQRFGP